MRRAAARRKRLSRPSGYIHPDGQGGCKQLMDIGTGYFGHVALTAGTVRGSALLDPVLEIELQIRADGLAPGVAAMIVTSCHVQGPKLTAGLGKAETIITQLGFASYEGGGKPYATSEFARWRLTQTGVEQLERVRGGGNLTLYVTPEVVLLNHGEPVPGAYPPPEGAIRPNVSRHSPIRSTGQERLDVPAETWAHQVLTPWQQAAAVTLVVKLPEAAATDDHRTVIRELTDARQRLDKGDWKGSIRASRDAVEVLRAMHDEHLSPKKQRDVSQREAAILDAERQLIQSLFDYGSATHPDPALRGTAWNREHAMLALATATAVAQRLFSAAAA
jgi:hypothetical protein